MNQNLILTNFNFNIIKLYKLIKILRKKNYENNISLDIHDSM